MTSRYDETIRKILPNYPNVEQAAQEEGLTGVELIRRMMARESNFDPSIVSHRGAIGLMQLMPGTAEELGVDPWSPTQNLEGGIRYLSQQLDAFDGEIEYALAAYNAGPGNVRKSNGVPGFEETRKYIPAILGRPLLSPEQLEGRALARLQPEERAAAQAEVEHRDDLVRAFQKNLGLIKALNKRGWLPEGASALVMPDSFFQQGGFTALTNEQMEDYNTHAEGFIDFGVQVGIAQTAADETGWIMSVGQTIWRNLVGTATASDQYIQKAFAATGLKSEEAVLARRQAMEVAHNKVSAAFGAPEDPETRQMYYEQFPLTATLTGEVITFALMAAALPNPAAILGRTGGAIRGIARLHPMVRARAASIAAGQGRTSLHSLGSALSRVPLRTVGTARGTAAAGAAGGGIGMVSSLLVDPDADWLDHARATMSGVAAGTLLWTAAFGRPVGAVAREVFSAEVKGQLGFWGSASRAIRMSPNLTLGHMSGAGTIGAVWGTQRAIDQGKQGMEALYEGVLMGGEWMMGDLMIARVGGLARLAKARTHFHERLAANLEKWTSLSARNAQNLAGTAQLATRGVLTGTPGAAVGAALNPDDPLEGALWGAAATGIVGTAAMYAGAPSVVPKSILKKFAAGGALDEDELKFLGQWIVKQSAHEAATVVDDDVVAEAMHVAAGRIERTGQFDRHPMLRRVNEEIHAAQMEFMKITGGMEALPRTAEQVTQVMQVAGRLLALRERRAQLITATRRAIRKAGSEAEVGPEVQEAIRPLSSRVPTGVLRQTVQMGRTLERNRARDAAQRTAAYNLERAAERADATGRRVRENVLESQRARAARQARKDARLAKMQREFDDAQAEGEALSYLDEFEDRLALTSQKSKWTQEAWESLGERPYGEIWDELAVALDVKRSQIKKMFDNDLEQARLLLARLRAETRQPLSKLEKPTTMRILSREVQEEADQLFDTIDLIDSKIGQGAGVQRRDIAEVAERLGASLSYIRENGVPKQMLSIPGLGVFTSAWDVDLLHQVRDALKSVRYDLLAIGSGVLLGASTLSEATMRHEGAWVDHTEGDRNRMAWIPNAAAASILVGLGVFVRKGVPKDLNQLLREVTKGIRRAGGKFDREVAFVLRSDGEMRMVRGELDGRTISSERLAKALEGRAMMFSVHNHEVPEQMVGLRLLNKFPSPADLRTFVLTSGGRQQDDVIHAVIAPDGTVSLVHMDLSDPRNVQKLLTDAVEERNILLTHMARRAKTPSKEWEAIIREHNRQFGEEATRDLMHQSLAALGVRVELDVPLESVEAAFQRARGRTMPFNASGISQSLARALMDRMIRGGIDPTKDIDLKSVLQKEFGITGVGGRRVAPRGATRSSAPVASTITQQGVSSNGHSFKRLQAYMRENGMDLTVERTGGRTVYTARDANGKVISMEGKLSAVVQDLGSKADRTLLGTQELGQGVFQTKAGGLIGAGLGAYFGGRMQDWLSDETPEDTTAGMVVGAFAGYLAMAFAGAKRAGLGLSASAEQVFKFYKPENPLSPLKDGSKVRSRLGKSDVRKAEFIGWTSGAQVIHLINRVVRIARRKSERDVRVRDIAKEVRKFTPNSLSGNQYDRLRNTLYEQLRALDVEDADIETLWRGMIGNMMNPMERRAGISFMEMWELSRKVPNVTDDELRRRVTTAEIISGPPPPVPNDSVEAAMEGLERGLSPEGKELREIAAVAAKQDTSFRDHDGPIETGGRLGIPFLSSLLPTERFRSVGNKLLNMGNHAGADILKLHDALLTATRRIRGEFDDEFGELNRIFQGMDQEQRKMVKHIITEPNDEVSIAAIRENPALERAAVEFKALLDKHADRLFPKQIKKKVELEDGTIEEQLVDLDRSDWAIENYFPWYYSPKTMEQLVRDGVMPTSWGISMGSGIPEYKIWRSMMKRGADPKGQIIEDPLEAGAIYLNGAIRKANLDRVAAEFDGKWFKRLQRSEPIIASDMAKWYMDVMGIPGPQYMKGAAYLRSIGMRLENINAFGFNQSEFVQDIIQKYFLSRDAAHRFTRMVRGFEFYSKLGFSMVSALVNSSQLVVNTGTEVGFNHLFIGGVPRAIKEARGMLGEKFPRALGWIDPQAKGMAKLRLARKVGVYSDNAKQVLDQLAYREWEESGKKVGTAVAGAAVAGAVGSVGVGALADDANVGIGAGLASVAVVGGIAMHRPAIIRKGLQKATDTIIFPFQMVEAINRGVTAGGARHQILAHRAAVRKYGAEEAARRAARGELVESGLVGATAGAAIGGMFADDEDRAAGAGVGALAGAALGAGLGRGQTRFSRMQALIDQQEKGTIVPLLRQRLVEQGVPSRTEINRWYVRMVLDQTQFRFGREARGELLRTPVGEVMGALQSFTLNQMEFVGRRFDDFAASMTKAIATGNASDIDTRVWRHLMLVIATGSAMTSLTMGLGSDRSPDYWISRIGFGMIPLVSYNEDARKWQLTDIGSHMKGPFINDVERAAGTVLRIMTDPVAARELSYQADGIARQWFSALRQIEAAPMVVGEALDKMHMEGAAELVRQQEEMFLNIGSPAQQFSGQGY